jgi:predicted TIM-barrel fold metal-dependent hydrolase
MKNVWFDVTVVSTGRLAPDQAARAAERIRQLGVQRVLYGSDAPTPAGLPRLMWAAFRKLPLTGEEFRAIENNLAPYMR